MNDNVKHVSFAIEEMKLFSRKKERHCMYSLLICVHPKHTYNCHW